MHDPVEWLAAKLTEAEALARKTMRGGSPIDDEEESHWYVAGSGMVRNDTERITDLIHIHDAPHIALWDPATVLRLVAATREVLGLHGPYGITCDICVLEFVRYDGPDMEPYPCPTVRELAKGWGWTDE